MQQFVSTDGHCMGIDHVPTVCTTCDEEYDLPEGTEELKAEIKRRNEMGMKLNDLSVLAYANNFTLWHYKTTDDSVESAGYFNKAWDMMNLNDLMIVNVHIESGPSVKQYMVSGKTNGVVTISPIA